MAYDFPNTPTTGQVVTGPGGIQWQFDGVKWTVVGSVPRFAGNNVTVAPIPPATPLVGDFWWDSANTANLYIWFNDGTSSQWVIANAASPTIPEAPADGRAYLRQGSSQNWTAGQPLAGVVDGSNAAPGVVGEYMLAIASNLTANIGGSWILATNVSLTAGDWDLEGMAYTVVSSGQISNFAVMLSTSNSPGAGWPPATAPFSGAQLNTNSGSVLGNNSLFTGVTRFSVSATTVVYLHWLCTAGAASQAYAAIRARRVR